MAHGGAECFGLKGRAVPLAVERPEESLQDVLLVMQSCNLLEL